MVNIPYSYRNRLRQFLGCGGFALMLGFGLEGELTRAIIAGVIFVTLMILIDLIDGDPPETKLK